MPVFDIISWKKRTSKRFIFAWTYQGGMLFILPLRGYPVATI
jgi:hypothetical protein